MLATHIAWAAGLFEGEGCISMDGDLAKIKLSMTDKDIVERFANLFSLNVLGPYKYSGKRSHCKEYFVAQSKKQDKVREIVSTLLPYFGDRRAHKALDILDRLECT